MTAGVTPLGTEIPMGDLIRIILLVIIPPVGVLFTVGLGLQFFINVILTLFGYIPGLIHAVWVVTRR
ncbi:protein of unknown function UPF0057 [Methylobacterium sp. 4-46]|nr:protein of unknown function UPF0057 [Methylobacterium sp. 4-46]